MSDLISRKQAIEEVKKIFTFGGCHCDVYAVVGMLNGIPSAEQKGRWQRRKGSDCWECSKCHAVLESDDIVRHNFYYCYHCGADMMNEDGYMKLEGTDHE